MANTINVDSRDNDLETVARIMAQQHGVTREQFEKFVGDKMRENAQRFDWRPSELAMTLGDLSRVCEKVWGKN